MGEQLAIGCDLIPDAVLDNFLIFSEHHLLSRDIDPVYPVLRSLYDQFPENRHDARLWWTLMYAAYYKVSSMEEVRINTPAFRVPADRLLKLPTGTERRGHRDARKLRRHIEAMLAMRERHGTLIAWLQDGFTGDPFVDFTQLRRNVEACWGNGAWASYKVADLVQAVHGWKIRATSAGQDHAGPRDGGRLLWTFADQGDRKPTDIMELRATNLLREMEHRLPEGALEAAYPFRRLELNHVETCLCDFYSMTRGRYYVGHDIDAMLSELRDPRISEVAARRVLDARMTALPGHYLGEVSGWDSASKERNRAYRDNGIILIRTPLGTRAANKGTMDAAPTGVKPRQGSLFNEEGA